MAHSAMAPVAEAVYGVLQDTTLLAALAGGVHTDVPANPTYPFLWLEIFHETEQRGFGTGGLPEMDIRTHIFSQAAGLAEAHDANRLAIAVLRDVAMTVTGYAMCGHVFYRETISLADQEIQGVKVHELVSLFTAFVEEA